MRGLLSFQKSFQLLILPGYIVLTLPAVDSGIIEQLSVLIQKISHDPALQGLTGGIFQLHYCLGQVFGLFRMRIHL